MNDREKPGMFIMVTVFKDKIYLKKCFVDASIHRSRPEGRIETSSRDPGRTLLKSRLSNSRLSTPSSNGFPVPGHDQREAEGPCVGILQRDGNEASCSLMVTWTLSP